MRALIKLICSLILWLFMCFCIGIILVSWTVETRDFNTLHWIWSAAVGIFLFMVSSCCFYNCFKWGSSIQKSKTKVVPV